MASQIIIMLATPKMLKEQHICYLASTKLMPIPNSKLLWSYGTISPKSTSYANLIHSNLTPNTLNTSLLKLFFSHSEFFTIFKRQQKSL